MIHEIEAKTILSHVKQPDTWFGQRYNMNLYRGCQHGCIYCDSRSLCYGIEKFDDVLVKVNALDLLRRELARKRVKGRIGFGAMSDPYTQAEVRYNLTGRALAIIAEFGFPVHLLTKSDRVLRDLDPLRTIRQIGTLVSFTITTTDDELARKIEPGAPPPTLRFRAMRELTKAGISTGVTLMPVLPFITDNAENIRAIVETAADHGASYIIPGFGMTLRDRQRDHYYQQLDRHFPGLRRRYQRQFGLDYSAPPANKHKLGETFARCCDERGILPHVPEYQPDIPRQLSLL